MAKKKRKTKGKEKKSLTKAQIFFLGLLIGLGIYWIPLDNEFVPVTFTQSEWSKQPVQSVFVSHIPTTAPLLQHEGHLISYDGRNKNPYWVYHQLSPLTFEKNASRVECEFKEDPLLPSVLRATKRDYQGSGYDRGHLCAAADCTSQKAMDDSFLLTNIAPQAPAFNRGYWKKVENHIRELTKDYPTVHVFTGPLYKSQKERDGKRYVKYQVIGPNEVGVPTHFFTLIFVELPTKKMMGKAYILPNQMIEPNTPLKKFLVSVEEVEAASGVMFTQILE